MKRLIRLFAPLLVFATLTASAIDLGAAKSQGLVGEQPNGYLGIIQSSPDVISLVNEVNAKRKSIYQDIAKKNSISLQQAEKLGGAQAIKKTPGGQFVQQGGSWVKK